MCRIPSQIKPLPSIMNVQIAPFLFLQTVCLGILLFGLFASTQQKERTRSFNLLLVGIALVLGGTLIRALLFLLDFDFYLTSSARKNEYLLGSLEGIVLIFIFLSLFIKPLFFRSLTQTVSNKLILTAIFFWLAISIWTISTFEGLNPAQGIKIPIILIFLLKYPVGRHEVGGIPP